MFMVAKALLVLCKSTGISPVGSNPNLRAVDFVSGKEGSHNELDGRSCSAGAKTRTRNRGVMVAFLTKH